MEKTDSELIIHDRPLGLWFFGAAFLAIGVFILLTPDAPFFFGLIFGGIGGALIALTSSLTITADRRTRTLTLDYRSILKRSQKVVPFADIAAIEVEMSISSSKRGSRRRRTPTYRVAVRLHTGESIPFREYYSGGLGPRETMANQLRAFIGVSGTDMAVQSTPQERRNQSYADIYQEAQQAVTGNQEEEHLTDGVRWRMDTRAYGNAPVTRWASPDFKLDSGFIYIAQVMPGQKASASGIFGGLSNMLLKQSMSIYGFSGADTPGIENAQPMQNMDPRLEQHFMVFTSNLAAARQTLNPWVVTPLVNWALKNPMKQVQSGYGTQLAALYGPNGVTIALLGLSTPERLREITALGIELVKSQIA